MNIKAAIFDMDGTLIDSLMVWGVIWDGLGEKFLSEKGFRPSEEDEKSVRTLTLRDAMALIHEHYNMASSTDEILDEANRIIADFYSNEVKMKDGAKECLDYLKNSGVKMCIASASAPDLIKLAMKHCEIEEYFLGIISCSTVGKGKEFPDVFLAAIDFLGEDIEDTWLFEDSLVSIETASKIGLKAVGIYDKHNFGRDEMKKIAVHYIDEGETLLKLI